MEGGSRQGKPQVIAPHSGRCVSFRRVRGNACVNGMYGAGSGGRDRQISSSSSMSSAIVLGMVCGTKIQLRFSPGFSLQAAPCRHDPAGPWCWSAVLGSARNMASTALSATTLLAAAATSPSGR